jgi:molybdenum cofactor biosynthesis protein A
MFLSRTIRQLSSTYNQCGKFSSSLHCDLSTLTKNDKFIVVGTSFRSLANTQQERFSSLATMPSSRPEEDEEENENDYPYSSGIANNQNRFIKITSSNAYVKNSKKIQSTRPRLEKLRKQLELEKIEGRQTIPKFQKSAVEVTKNNHSLQETPSWQDILTKAKASLNNIAPSPTEMVTDKYKRYHTYLRISLSERCNLRCRYCMPPEGVPLQQQENILTTPEINKLVHLFAQSGIDKVRLTGGEPLLRKDLSEIISSIRTNNTIHSVGITTNGLTLSRQLPALLEAGLTHINISLDTLCEDKFSYITRRKGLFKVLQAIKDAGEALPAGRVKINCVVMNDFNHNELRDFIMLTKDLPVDVRFIEWMPFNDNGWNKNRFFSYADMLESIRNDSTDNRVEASLKGVGPLNLTRLTDGSNDTTKWWQVPGFKGRIGFITSMSEHFCGTCNRLRIMADGQLKVCLFGSQEVSLRDAIRAGVSNEDLSFIIHAAVQKKTFALGGHGNAEGIAKANDNRPMTLIGG